jgi:hypothetical protein
VTFKTAQVAAGGVGDRIIEVERNNLIAARMDL